MIDYQLVRWYILFPDAEIFENVSKELVGGDWHACYGGEGVDCWAEVLCNKVGRQGGGESFSDFFKAAGSFFQGLVMSGVGDKNGVVSR